MCFRHPAPHRARPRIFPIFLPNAGCPHRCLFCDQEGVTGLPEVGTVSKGLEQTLDELPGRLEALGSQPVEAAFYGGTFTALPEGWPLRFLEALHPFRQRGLVTAARCSTRPDAVTSGQLARLAAAGLDTVELGVQTFDDSVLRAACRGHDAEASLRACALVRAAGLGLGLQLLPGLPGHTPGAFVRDIAQCLALRPDFVRIHPCLVLKGTGLESLWRKGAYQPWDMPDTLEALGEAVWRLWRGNISVARLGLTPEASLLSAILAGPWHPALGTRVRARALWHEIRHRLEGPDAPDGPHRPGTRRLRLSLPQRWSGEFWGHAGEMEPRYRVLGLARDAVRFTPGDEWVLETLA